MPNSYKNSLLDLTSTSETTLYTVPTATSTIFKSILVSDDSGSGDSISLTLTNGANVFSIYKTKTVGANGTEELLSQPLVLEEGQVLKVTATTADRLHVVGSFIEVT
jgi:hypothetical protein